MNTINMMVAQLMGWEINFQLIGILSIGIFPANDELSYTNVCPPSD
jgi:hypothetical protein